MKTKALKLDSEEAQILKAYEKGKLKKSKISFDVVAMAKTTLKKNKNINIRISENDLNTIKLKAVREGIPYQTLIGSIIHKFAASYLVSA